MLCVVTIMGKHHTDIRQFRIFALVLGEDFFIGKTASPRISAVYSRHRCGNVAATRGTMDQVQPPSLYILEELKCTGAEAYRHILAWIRRFEEAGYCAINHTGTVIASETLYPPAEVLLDKLLQEPMDRILERAYVPKPSTGNRKPSRIKSLLSKPDTHVQMNLRMTAKDKNTFDRFCKTHHLKAREALGLLLDQATGDKEHLLPLLSKQNVLKQEINQLQAKLTAYQENALSARDQQASDYLFFLKTGLTEYLQYLFPQEERGFLPSFPYKRFRDQSDSCYEYPKSEGFLLLRTEAVLWGRHRARFIIGRDQSGNCLKIRYYPKPLYAGALMSDYSAGTHFLVGCQRAADGAMEVAAAFPIPPLWKFPKAAVVPSEIPKRLSLDDQIYIASR